MHAFAPRPLIFKLQQEVLKSVVTLLRVEAPQKLTIRQIF